MSETHTQNFVEEGRLAVERAIPEDQEVLHDDDVDEEDEQDDDTSFGLCLEERGQTGGYHTANDPNDRFHRATVTDRDLHGAIDIRGKSKVIIHGYMDPDSDEAATLLVYDFTFNSTKRFRRVASANITFEFAGCEPGQSGPEVRDVAPSGRWSLAETTQKEHIEHTGSANLTVGYQGASAGGTSGWTKSLDREGRDSTIINGDTICNAYGKETGAKFTLLENASASPKIGVPSFFRLAILLARKTDVEFQCAVNIEIEADWKTRMDTFFAAKTQDDPIYFDPGLPPMNKLKNLKHEIDAEDLGAIKMDELFDATMYTTFKRAIKEQD